jgi:hypothetical protein
MREAIVPQEAVRTGREAATGRRYDRGDRHGGNMPTPVLRKLSEDLARLEDEIALMVSAARTSDALQDLRKRADDIRQAIEALHRQ